MKIIALSGSSRTGSYNTALLRAAARLAPAPMDISVFDSVAGIPVFSPEIPPDQLPQPVTELQELLRNAAGVIISTPEYAYGVSGVLKNALDWLVSSGELVLKPVVVTSVSSSQLGGVRAHHSLLITLHAMNASVVVDASLCVPFAKAKFADNGELLDPLIASSLQNSLSILQHVIAKDH